MAPSIFFIEGNIGIGKSSALNVVKQLKPMWEVEDEPLANWAHVDGDNILQLFYTDPKKHAFRFQLHVLDTFAAQLEQLRHVDTVHLIGRSPLSTTAVFTRAAYEQDSLTPQQYNYLTDKCHDMEQRLPKGVHIYLRGSPELAYERMAIRRRKEEEGVSVGYLRLLHLLHERTFVENSKTIIVDDFAGKQTIEETGRIIVNRIEASLSAK